MPVNNSLVPDSEAESVFQKRAWLPPVATVLSIAFQPEVLEVKSSVVKAGEDEADVDILYPRGQRKRERHAVGAYWHAAVVRDRYGRCHEIGRAHV